jgi:tRNA(Ile)-lysidine synthetase-like protein
MNELINWPKSGKYVVAVSGGADSVTLLHILATSGRDYELIVAHYDHAIRTDSARDSELVESLAKKYGLEYRTERSATSINSEAQARDARFEFLNRIMLETNSSVIITAHHQDDVIETSLLNVARGSGRRGLAPMESGEILRPLLGVSRNQLRAYAMSHDLHWNEDITNEDQSNPRNFLRRSLLSSASDEWRKGYLALIEDVGSLNILIDNQLEECLERDDQGISMSRDDARSLSSNELKEALVYAVRAIDETIEVNDRLVKELAHFIKSGKIGRRRPVSGQVEVELQREYVRFYGSNIGAIEGK